MWQTSRSQSQLCSDHTVLLFPVAHDVYLSSTNLHLTLSLRNTWQSLMSWLISFNIKINKDNNIMFIIFITSLTFNHNTEAILFFLGQTQRINAILKSWLCSGCLVAAWITRVSYFPPVACLLVLIVPCRWSVTSCPFMLAFCWLAALHKL